jgi:pimeloyl-ACP methyl ester carboxylesterase
VTDSEIRYVRTAGGSHLAYQVKGDGPVDLVDIGGYGTLFPLDAADDQPQWRRFEDRLSRFCRLIRFDLRGIGFSDPLTEPPSVEMWVADTLAVLDAAGSERTAVLGSSFGGLAALRLAADHPDRVSALVLANTGARFMRADDYSVGASAELGAQLAAITDPDGGPGSDIDYMAPSIAADREARRWWTRTARRGAGPAVADEMWKVSLEGDVRDALPRIAAPVLVIRTLDCQFIRPQVTGWLADHLPAAELCDLPGSDQVVWAVPDDLVSNRIEEFLTGSRSAATGTRRIHAVLFTDIVDSTAHNTSSGDRAWLDLLTRHDRLAERAIRQRGGRLVKRLGDGLLAEFPLATDALDVGRAVVDAAAANLEVGVRAAVHVAEVEETADDVLGLGVTIAARVLGLADGGEVLTTQAVVELLAGSGRRFERRGDHQLKGVDGFWAISAVTSA